MWITVNDTHKLYKSYQHKNVDNLCISKLPESYPQNY